MKNSSKDKSKKVTSSKKKKLITNAECFSCYFDGCCEPTNPGGHMGLGYLVRKEDELLLSNSEHIEANPKNTNNVAEYLAFERILDYFISSNIISAALRVYGDSKMVINQMSGAWRINPGKGYTDYAARCMNKLNILRREKHCRITLTWIPREDNQICDDLSKAKMLENNVDFKLQPVAQNSVEEMEYREKVKTILEDNPRSKFFNSLNNWHRPYTKRQKECIDENVQQLAKRPYAVLKAV